MKEKIGVIILNYNSDALVENLVKNLEKMNSNLKIIIVDNCSLDNSFENLKKLQNQEVYLFKTKQNLGYANGNNCGYLKMKELYPDIKYFAILNPDIEIKNKYIFEELVEVLKINKELALVTPLMCMNGNFDIKNVGWKAPGFLSLLSFNSSLLSKLCIDRYRKLKINDNGVIYIDVVSGSFLFFNSEDFENIKMLDENTFLYFEENIIYEKLKLLEKKIGVYPESIYYHNHIHKKLDLKSRLIDHKRIMKSCIYYVKVYKKNKLLYLILKLSYPIRKVEILLISFFNLLFNKLK